MPNQYGTAPLRAEVVGSPVSRMLSSSAGTFHVHSRDFKHPYFHDFQWIWAHGSQFFKTGRAEGCRLVQRLRHAQFYLQFIKIKPTSEEVWWYGGGGCHVPHWAMLVKVQSQRVCTFQDRGVWAGNVSQKKNKDTKEIDRGTE